MKILVILCFLLAAGSSFAETKIIEYPDHVYVEAEGNTEHGAEAPPVAGEDCGVSERKAGLSAEIRRLQKERTELMKPVEWDTPNDKEYKSRAAREKQEEISRLTKELAELRERKAGGE